MQQLPEATWTLQLHHDAGAGVAHMVCMLRSVLSVALTVRGSNWVMTSDLVSDGMLARIAAASGRLKTPA